MYTCVCVSMYTCVCEHVHVWRSEEGKETVNTTANSIGTCTHNRSTDTLCIIQTQLPLLELCRPQNVPPLTPPTLTRREGVGLGQAQGDDPIMQSDWRIPQELTRR